MCVSFFLVSSLTILLTCCFSVKTSLFYSILFLRISFYPPYTEYRKGEMGLRMALGSTRRQLNSIMVGEGVLLLVLVFIPSLVISFNIAHMDLIDTYQLPFTWLRFAICGGITFVLIVLMIICGVWYPARSTARLEPAEALHYE